MVEENAHEQCKLLTQVLRSCTVSRGLWIVTTLEVITQPSLSKMFIRLQYPDLGHEEVGLVVREVSPKKPSPNYLETNFASLQSGWAGPHHSQIGNIIEGSFWVPTTPLVAKFPSSSFLFCQEMSSHYFWSWPSTQKQNKTCYFSESHENLLK